MNSLDPSSNAGITQNVAFPARWEQGSEFHLLDAYAPSEATISPWDGAPTFYGTGRDALSHLISTGMQSLGWKRIWVPAYFCQEVVGAIVQTRIEVVPYRTWLPDSTKTGTPIHVTDGDVVFIVNLFGMMDGFQQSVSPDAGVVTIEDHTHDPWSQWAFTSTADYCIASLRKVFPIPDGAVLWSPRHCRLPPQPNVTAQHHEAAHLKFKAMQLKSLYLAGAPVAKEEYRNLAVAGEQQLFGSGVSGIHPWSMEHMRRFPAGQWRWKRSENLNVMERELSGLDCLHVLPASKPGGGVPFAAVLLFEEAGCRDFVRSRLLLNDIYPLLLWPLEHRTIDGIGAEEIETSRRIMMIHCDMRYSTEDIRSVAGRIVELCHEYHRRK